MSVAKYVIGGAAVLGGLYFLLRAPASAWSPAPVAATQARLAKSPTLSSLTLTPATAADVMVGKIIGLCLSTVDGMYGALVYATVLAANADGTANVQVALVPGATAVGLLSDPGAPALPNANDTFSNVPLSDLTPTH